MIPIRQNIDTNARASDFELAPKQMLITSMFKTLQGEGPFAGHHAFFIRTAGCNFGAKDIACQWCDTSFKIADGKALSFADIAQQLEEHSFGDFKPLVVLTGGEPLLQPNAPDFVAYLLNAGYQVQVETNGSFLHKLSNLAITAKSLHIVCSPKQIKGNYAKAAPDFAYTLATNPVHFKFVVSADPETGHNVIPDWANEVNAEVWVSPMTVYRKAYSGEVSSIWDSELVDQERTADNYRYAAELVLGNPNLKFSCQVHTFMGIA